MKKTRQFVWVSEHRDWEILNSSIDVIMNVCFYHLEDVIEHDALNWPGEISNLYYYRLRVNGNDIKVMDVYSRKEAERMIKLGEL